MRAIAPDRQTITGWRLVEKYCSSDPCDPSSAKPGNIENTAGDYEAMAVSNLLRSFAATEDDHFAEQTLPGIARFCPDLAVRKHRELIDDVLHREKFEHRQGVLNLVKHSVVFTNKQRAEFVEKWRSVNEQKILFDLTEQDSWIVKQFYLLFGIQSLAPEDQVSLLLDCHNGDEILQDVVDLVGALGLPKMDDFITRCGPESPSNTQLVFLLLLSTPVTRLSLRLEKYIADSVSSTCGKVRAASLATVANNGSVGMLNAVVEDGRVYRLPGCTDRLERIHGSQSLIKAAEVGLISPEDVFARICPEAYGVAARVLGGDLAKAAAREMDVLLMRAAGVEFDQIGPSLDLEMQRDETAAPGFVTVRDLVPSDDHEALNQLADTAENFEDRQWRNTNAYLRFVSQLSLQDLIFILEYIGPEDFKCIVKADASFANKWTELLLELAEADVPAFYNMIVLFAFALSDSDPVAAVRLFEKVERCTPLIKIKYADSGMDFLGHVVWLGDENKEMNQLRFRRLDSAATDHALATETLAAHLNNKKQLLEQYISSRMKSGIPVQMARAVMVAGFSEQSTFNDDVLASRAEKHGLLGDAVRAATDAYNRNSWARHWYATMCAAETGEDLWQAQILFEKLVDGRFALWKREWDWGDAFSRYRITSLKGVRRRIERWKAHRSKKLFGQKAPEPVFLRAPFR